MMLYGNLTLPSMATANRDQACFSAFAGEAIEMDVRMPDTLSVALVSWIAFVAC
jgi:hypothetical protein